MYELLDALAAMPDEIRRQSCRKKFSPGESILLKGGEIKHLYVLLKGTVRVSNEFMDGHRYSFTHFSAPSFIGEVEILASQPHYAATVEASTTCDLLAMTSDAFLQWVQSSTAMALLAARIVAEKMYPTANEHGTIKFVPGRQRLVEYLVHSCPPDARIPFLLRKKRQDIADAIGTSIKTVNRCVAELKAAGSISLVHGKISISRTQHAALEQLLEK